MSDLSTQRDLVRRLEQTQVKEVPGGITGFTSFYDIGTYTPTYLGGTTPGATTYSVQAGTWTRIGRVIIATGTVVWTAATGTGDAQISLPFTAANVANQNFAISVRTAAVTFANGTPQGQIAANTAYLTMQSPLTNAPSTAVAVEAAGNVIFTAIYFV